MKVQRFHRIIGLIMLIPLLGWGLTGIVFLLKPGYEGAYSLLSTKTYPMSIPLSFTPDATWQSVSCFRTVLGNHLIAQTGDGPLHLDPATLQSRQEPALDDIRTLLTDACSVDPQRYGSIVNITNGLAHTDTGIEITWDWATMSLSQRGQDTDRIDWLYRIHYLQWTGVPAIDKPLAVVGIALLLILTVLGLSLAMKKA